MSDCLCFLVYIWSSSPLLIFFLNPRSYHCLNFDRLIMPQSPPFEMKISIEAAKQMKDPRSVNHYESMDWYFQKVSSCKTGFNPVFVKASIKINLKTIIFSSPILWCFSFSETLTKMKAAMILTNVIENDCANVYKFSIVKSLSQS